MTEYERLVEAVKKPIVYTKLEGDLLVGKGEVKWSDFFDRSWSVFHFFNKSSTDQVFSEVWVHSLNVNNPAKIAIFKVKKLHDTK